jgi:coenzyme F420 biosynthesis associated uncharacterized protein
VAEPAPAVDWDVARRVAGRIARRAPYGPLAAALPLTEHFAEATSRAEGLVAATTGLPPAPVPARARVVDRAGWVDVNVESFQRLLRPLLGRLEERVAASRFPRPLAKVAGAEVGALLGWMSTRVLGQYDLLIIEDERPEDQDVVYYVGPNIVDLERRFAFPADQFRLWVAVHECTHRAQFTGVPWLRPYFLSLVDDVLAGVETDPSRALESLRAALGEARRGRRALDRAGLAAMLASPAQRQALDRVGGLMSLLEGHGDVIMTRASAGHVPQAERFERVLRARRQSAGGLTRLLQRLVGLEAKLAQYAEGAHFIGEVERAGGLDLFDRVWRGPEWLPTLEEVRDPGQWVDRVRLSEAIGG